MATGGCPPWRPSSQRQRETLLLGATAARRAARARARAALEAALVPLAQARATPGPWVDRERAARPALKLAVEGSRVPGSKRRRRNAALHAQRVPPGGFAQASVEGLAWAAAGPRLGPGGGGLPAADGTGAVLGDPVEDLAPGVWRLPVEALADAFCDGLRAGLRLAPQLETEDQHEPQPDEDLEEVQVVSDVAQHRTQGSRPPWVVGSVGGTDTGVDHVAIHSEGRAEVVVPRAPAVDRGSSSWTAPQEVTHSPWVPSGLPADPGEGRLFDPLPGPGVRCESSWKVSLFKFSVGSDVRMTCWTITTTSSFCRTSLF